MAPTVLVTALQWIALGFVVPAATQYVPTPEPTAISVVQPLFLKYWNNFVCGYSEDTTVSSRPSSSFNTSLYKCTCYPINDHGFYTGEAICSAYFKIKPPARNPADVTAGVYTLTYYRDAKCLLDQKLFQTIKFKGACDSTQLSVDRIAMVHCVRAVCAGIGVCTTSGSGGSSSWMIDTKYVAATYDMDCSGDDTCTCKEAGAEQGYYHSSQPSGLRSCPTGWESYNSAGTCSCVIATTVR